MANFLKSAKVKVYPCAYRGQVDIDGDDHVINPESRLPSEFNVSNQTFNIADSFIIKPDYANISYLYTDSDEINLEFVLHGYWFKINGLKIQDLGLSAGDIFAYIQLENRNSNYNVDDDITDYPDLALKSLNPDPNESALDFEQSGELFFNGLGFSNTEQTGTNVYSIKLFEYNNGYKCCKNSYTKIKSTEVLDSLEQGPINEIFTNNRANIVTASIGSLYLDGGAVYGSSMSRVDLSTNFDIRFYGSSAVTITSPLTAGIKVLGPDASAVIAAFHSGSNPEILISSPSKLTVVGTPISVVGNAEIVGNAEVAGNMYPAVAETYDLGLNNRTYANIYAMNLLNPGDINIAADKAMIGAGHNGSLFLSAGSNAYLYAPSAIYVGEYTYNNNTYSADYVRVKADAVHISGYNCYMELMSGAIGFKPDTEFKIDAPASKVKLANNDVGASNTPIYLKNGKLTACTYPVIDSDSGIKYLETSYALTDLAGTVAYNVSDITAADWNVNVNNVKFWITWTRVKKNLLVNIRTNLGFIGGGVVDTGLRISRNWLVQQCLGDSFTALSDGNYDTVTAQDLKKDPRNSHNHYVDYIDNNYIYVVAGEGPGGYVGSNGAFIQISIRLA